MIYKTASAGNTVSSKLHIEQAMHGTVQPPQALHRK